MSKVDVNQPDEGPCWPFLAETEISDSSLFAFVACIVKSSPFVLVVVVIVLIVPIIVLIVLVVALVEVKFVVKFVLHVF